LIVAAALVTLAPSQASAQPPFAAPAPPPPAPPAPEPPPPPAPAGPPAPVAPSGPPAPALGATDHDTVVGRWGVEARHLGNFPRTPGNDLRCTGRCDISINSFSVRRWSTHKYAWSAGLALGVGGGSRYEPTVMAVQSWDTYLGFGPTLGASFLLTNWQHLTVSLSPQLDAVFFIPRSTGSKTFLLNVRGLLEGELHLGFIGLPELSVGLASGLVVNFKTISKSELTVMTPDAGTASEWNIGFSGPQSFWGLVTNAYLRFYF
jgi:hypothetical protein